MLNDKNALHYTTVPVIENSFTDSDVVNFCQLINTVIVKTQTIFSILILLISFSCKRNQRQSPLSITPKVVKAQGYKVPKDSIAEPQVIPVGKPTVVLAGKPKVVPTNTNVHPAGTPAVVIAGIPRVCTPGKDSFSIPKSVPTIDSPFIAGIPEVVIAKDPFTKDQNPQNFSSFSKLQGLRSVTVNCLLEDKSGNLWIGTNFGPSKYDGKSFTHFTEKEGLSSNWLACMLEDKSGNIWFGTYDGGVSRYDGKRFTHFTIKEGLSHNWVTSILQDMSGDLWFGTNGGGVSRYDGKIFTHFTVKEGMSSNLVLSMLEDKKTGDLWFGTDGGGVTKFDRKSFRHFTKKEGLGGNIVMSILKDERGLLWFGTEGGVSRFDGRSFTNFRKNEGLISNGVASIHQDESGHLWFGTGAGVSKYDGKNFTHFTEKEGLSDNEINCILKDKRGNLWVGTASGGVNKYGGQRFTHFTKEEGLGDDNVRNIVEDKDGNLWFGTYGAGVNRYDGKSFTHFTTKEGMRLDIVRSILEDNSGNLWFGDWNGVSKYDGKSFTYFTTNADMNTNMLQDKKGNLWFGSFGDGVFKFDGKRFINFTTKEGLSGNYVSGILQDKNGRLWFSTEHGLTEYDDTTFTHFTKKEGLSDDDVFCIAEDNYGNIWVGTKSGGVNKYDGKNFTHYTQREGLSNNLVTSILKDKSGNLWFGTLFGLNKLAKNKVASDLSDSEFLFKTYTYDDGFSGIGVNNVGKSIFEAKDGTIWIGANDRLTAYHPDEDVPDTIPPNIQLTGLSLFNENIAWQNLEKKIDTSIALSNGVSFHDFHFDSISKWYSIPQQLSLPYSNNYLTFQFLGITTQSPKKVKYKFKLEGIDKNWNALTNSTQAAYGNLPHGTYTFKVKAMNGDGYWSREFNYSFTIRPPWWRTWWFTTLAALVVVAGVYGYIQYRSRNLKQRNILLENKVTERTHELNQSLSKLKNTQEQLVHSEKMASLGELTSGIAHEIKNPLNFINNFSELNLDLLTDVKEEQLSNPDKTTLAELVNMIKTLKKNSEKINHHGKRVDDIVKSMLQHSRTGNLAKEPVNVNALCEESLKLAYHGFKAKEKTFQASFETHFEAGLPTIMAIPQELSRVLLNLCNNAFYAVHEKKRKLQPVSTDASEVESLYKPMVTVSTRQRDNKIMITVSDNGTGIPQKIISKIFQPFFTTKPTGEGTGLGLSMSYDIITKSHGGELYVKSKEGEGTTFEIVMPV